MTAFDKIFAGQCEKSIERFKDILPVPWRPRSILLSEAFAVCAMCDLYGIELFIESGIYEGRSTMVWGKYLPKVIAFDVTIRPGVSDRLHSHNICLRQGDARALIPEEITPAVGRTGLFLDGPKGSEAILFGRRCMNHANVQFVAIHDMHTMSSGNVNVSRVQAENVGFQFFTDAGWFVDQYKWLDEGESQYDKDQDIQWVPGELITGEGKPRRELGSYGPTVGFLIANPKE